MILFMSPNEVEWNYIAVTKLSALLRGVTSKHQNKKGLKLNISVFRSRNVCSVRMSFEEHVLLEFTQYLKLNRTPSPIDPDLEPLVKKTSEIIK